MTVRRREPETEELIELLADNSGVEPDTVKKLLDTIDLFGGRVVEIRIEVDEPEPNSALPADPS